MHPRLVGQHAGGVAALALASQGRTLVTCGADRRVCVYTTGEDGGGGGAAGCVDAVASVLVAAWDSPTEPVSLAVHQSEAARERGLVSGDSLLCVCAGAAGALSVGRVDTSGAGTPEVEALPAGQDGSAHAHAPHTLLLSAAGTELYMAAAQCPDVTVYRLAGSGAKEAVSHFWRGHKAAVTALALAAADSVLISASLDGTARCWGTATGACFAVLTSCQAAPPAPLRVLACDGGTVLTGGDDSVLRVWSCPSPGGAGQVSTGEGCLVRELRGHAGPITCLAVAVGGSARAFTSDSMGEVRGWQHNGELGGPVVFGNSHLHTGGESHGITALACSPQDSRWPVLFGAWQSGGITCWDAVTGAVLAQLGWHTRPVTCLALSPQHSGVLYSGSDDGHVAAWTFADVAAIAVGTPGAAGHAWERGCTDGLSIAMAALLRDLELELPSASDVTGLEEAASAGAAALHARAVSLMEAAETYATLSPTAMESLRSLLRMTQGISLSGDSDEEEGSIRNRFGFPSGDARRASSSAGGEPHSPGPALTVDENGSDGDPGSARQSRWLAEGAYLGCGTLLPPSSPPESPVKGQVQADQTSVSTAVSDLAGACQSAAPWSLASAC
jgi:WD40 repeat protein